MCPTASNNLYRVAEENKKRIDSRLADIKEDLKSRISKAGYDTDLMFPDDYNWITEISRFKDSVMSYFNYYGKYPKGMDKQQYETIRLVGSFHLVLQSESVYSKMKTNAIAKKIMKSFKRKIKKYTLGGKLRYMGFSAHDCSLLPFMAIMKMADSECLLEKVKNNGVNPPSEEWCMGNPPYSSSLIFELSSN